MKFKGIPDSPMLDLDPMELPPYRMGTPQKRGALVKYIEACNPGLPPNGWVDITPYFGGMMKSGLRGSGLELAALARGYIIQKQIVTVDGYTYKRIAACKAPASSPAVHAARIKVAAIFKRLDGLDPTRQHLRKHNRKPKE